MGMYEIIRKKRDGIELSDEEIQWFIKGITSHEICDYQTSALLMAICFNSMTDRETVSLTHAMAHSGDTVDLSCFGTLSVDKHSTGGVGDKTTLIVAPIVASLGGKVSKMSGRGLGHTGGTIDKLEAIKGYNTSLSPEEFLSQVEKIGIAVVGQTGNLAPADKILYALRDVTATVDSIPLITSSIMSKKLAAGSHSIVLDVKCGSGAFMKTPQKASELAEKMVNIGRSCGRNMAALITDMDMPLGQAIGNSLEVEEAIRVLKNSGPEDLKKVSLSLAAEMLSLCLEKDIDETYKMAENAVVSGRAFEKMKEWVKAQGGDTDCLDDTTLLPKSDIVYEIKAASDGYITHMDAEQIGIASVTLGAGRKTKEDSINYAVGIMLLKKTGHYVRSGDVLCTLHTDNKESIEPAKTEFLSAVRLGNDKPEEIPLIYSVVR